MSAVFRETHNKKEVVLPLLDATGAKASASLDEREAQHTFYLTPYFELPPGDYVFENLRVSQSDSVTKKTIPLEIPVKNPFQAAGKPPIQFSVRAGRIAAVFRLGIQTLLTLKDSTLQALTEVEPIDREAVPVDIALEGLHRDSFSSPLLYAGSPDLPRTRVSITNSEGQPTPTESPVARVGLLLDVPCDAVGMLRLIWKRAGDDREYFSLSDLSKGSGTACKTIRTIAPLVELPRGDWWLKANYIQTSRSPLPNFRLQALKAPDATLQAYLSLSNRYRQFSNLYLEREIERQFVARLDGSSESDGFKPGNWNWREEVLYLGRFELVPKNSREDRFDSWDTLFKRNYLVSQLKDLFHAKNVYSAYTLDEITKDRSKGTAIKSVLKISAAASDVKKNEPLSTEFRKTATEDLARCVKDREEIDPLVNISGSLTFTALRAGNGINLKSFSFENSGLSDRWVQECFQKKLLAFRFSNRVPSSFQGELRFKSE